MKFLTHWPDRRKSSELRHSMWATSPQKLFPAMRWTEPRLAMAGPLLPACKAQRELELAIRGGIGHPYGAPDQEMRY